MNYVKPHINNQHLIEQSRKHISTLIVNTRSKANILDAFLLDRKARNSACQAQTHMKLGFDQRRNNLRQILVSNSKEQGYQ